MFDPQSFGIFILASLTLLLIPGPAVLYVVTQSVQQGTKAGLVGTSGIALGGLVHVLAASFGLSALLVASTTAYLIVKWAGAAYLIYLGIKTLRKANQVQEKPKAKLKTAFWRGVFVQILNPKSAMFMLAFLPQFTDPTRGSMFTQMLTLGLIFALMGLITDSFFALLSGRLSQWIGQSQTYLNIQQKFCGSIYIGLGALATLGSPQKT